MATSGFCISNTVQYTTMSIIIKNQSDSIILRSIKEQYLCLIGEKNYEKITNLDFINKINEMSKMGEIAIAYYIEEDTNNVIIVGTGSLYIELKINGKNIGYIEDIHIYNDCKLQTTEIIRRLSSLASKNHCYKVIINCKRDNAKTYEQIGFDQTGIEMTKLFS